MEEWVNPVTYHHRTGGANAPVQVEVSEPKGEFHVHSEFSWWQHHVAASRAITDGQTITSRVTRRDENQEGAVN